VSFRPYPNADRALRQLDRHYPPVPAVQAPECLRPVVASFAQLRVSARQAVEAAGEAGAYRLSTRRPGVVGGGS
jgi:predicted lysophospholipase L1 biosynthesis ABC-type transport system permease subunit